MNPFEALSEPTIDPIFVLNSRYLADPSPLKVNLGIGAYRTDEGKPWILPSVQKAKDKMAEDESINHEYLPLTGLVSMNEGTARLVFGANSSLVVEKRLACQQTISGTGANHLAALFLSQSYGPWQDAGEKVVHVPDPTWAGHYGIFGHLGLTVRSYPWYDPTSCSLSFASLLAYISSLPPQSVILLHACAHNPTGVDPDRDQWRALADLFVSKGHFAFFDSAYLGFVSGDVDEDAFAIRHFAERRIPMLVCQSWSKNAGLYGERVGCLMVVGRSQEEARKILGHTSWLQRGELSIPPAFGANVVSTILHDPELFQQWRCDLATMAKRIQGLRVQLRCLLEERYRTPGRWDHITRQAGMFCYLGLSPEQCRSLVDTSHIYLTDESRVSMAGLNSSNIDYVASEIDKVVRRSRSNSASAKGLLPPINTVASETPASKRWLAIETRRETVLRGRQCPVAA